MPITNVRAVQPDVLAQSSGNTYPTFQQHSSVICAAPRAANQLSVVNRDHTQKSEPTSGYAASVSGVEDRFNLRFTHYSYYTA